MRGALASLDGCSGRPQACSSRPLTMVVLPALATLTSALRAPTLPTRGRALLGASAQYCERAPWLWDPSRALGRTAAITSRQRSRGRWPFSVTCGCRPSTDLYRHAAHLSRPHGRRSSDGLCARLFRPRVVSSTCSPGSRLLFQPFQAQFLLALPGHPARRDRRLGWSCRSVGAPLRRQPVALAGRRFSQKKKTASWSSHPEHPEPRLRSRCVAV